MHCYLNYSNNFIFIPFVFEIFPIVCAKTEISVFFSSAYVILLHKYNSILSFETFFVEISIVDFEIIDFMLRWKWFQQKCLLAITQSFSNTLTPPKTLQSLILLVKSSLFRNERALYVKFPHPFCHLIWYKGLLWSHQKIYEIWFRITYVIIVQQIINWFKKMWSQMEAYRYMLFTSHLIPKFVWINSENFISDHYVL